MEHCKHKGLQQLRRQRRVSNAVKRVSTRPRLCVNRTLQHIYCQVIDDSTGRTLASASTVEKDIIGEGTYGGNCAAAAVIGKAIAERALAADVKSVAFDRRECKYHGRIAALANAAREAGLDIGVNGEPNPKAKKSSSGKDAKGGKKDAKAAKGQKKGK